MLTQAVLRDMLEAGVWAPSAENRHAFRYSVDGDRLRLHVDPAVAEATADMRYAALLSLGAVIENMRIAASVHGIYCHVQRERTSDLADIELECMSGGVPDDLAAYIKQRHTNRRLRYRGPRLEAAQRAEIEAALAPLGDEWRLRWFDEKPARIALCRLMREAEAHRFANEALHRAMFEGIRFDLGWRGGANEGLPPAALGIEPGMRAAFAALRHWSLARVLARIDLHRGIAHRASFLPARIAPHACVLTLRAPLETVDDLLRAGRAMERVWLAATRQRLAVQPFAAAVALAQPGRSALDDAARAQLVRAWHALLPDAHPVIVFRLGHSAPPAARAGRPLPSTLARH